MPFKTRCCTGPGLHALAASSLLLLTVAAGHAADYVSVAKDGVNLRSGPDTSYAVIYELPQGYPLTVLEKKGEWLKVSDYENDKGWISQSVVGQEQYVIVKAKEANIRSEPNTKSDTKGSIAKDVILRKVGKQGEWVQVSHPDVEGWIHGQLVWP